MIGSGVIGAGHASDFLFFWGGLAFSWLGCADALQSSPLQILDQIDLSHFHSSTISMAFDLI